MKLYEFKLLTQCEQNVALELFAVFLGERREEQYTYKLYQIDDFYVEEAWFSPFNERRGIISFVSTEKLQPYLHVIDISRLLS
jgi:hypothetical protein